MIGTALTQNARLAYRHLTMYNVQTMTTSPKPVRSEERVYAQAQAANLLISVYHCLMGSNPLSHPCPPLPSSAHSRFLKMVLCLQHHEDSAVDANNWFSTGDVASIDPLGFMRITDRSKDVIKSGASGSPPLTLRMQPCPTSM